MSVVLASSVLTIHGGFSFGFSLGLSAAFRMGFSRLFLQMFPRGAHYSSLNRFGDIWNFQLFENQRRSSARCVLACTVFASAGWMYL